MEDIELWRDAPLWDPQSIADATKTWFEYLGEGGLRSMESFGSHYQHKIKTAEEIAALVGNPPRKRKVIMCHGVFDVVHPGHLRHLLYAKSKADILVASLTADHHISKGRYRPHVPQDLRAINLAAFEIVDYVIIDPEPTPLKNLALIKPDIFAKGYEYQASGLPPKTQEELEVIRGYGGEIIFTPGDYRLLLEPADRSGAAVAAHRKAADADGERRPHLRQDAARARYARRPPRPCRRRHHRRYLHLHAP